MNSAAYRRQAERPYYPEDDETFVTKKKNRLVPVALRLLVIPAALTGPVASYAAAALAFNVAPQLAMAVGIFAFIAYLAGCMLVPGESRTYRSMSNGPRALALAWMPFFLLGLFAWSVTRWVAVGDRD